jgi:2,4-dienoyl-CoA reductase-like NADH-dependent reductase (Old Yellow Enzyme family)
MAGRPAGLPRSRIVRSAAAGNPHRVSSILGAGRTAADRDWSDDGDYGIVLPHRRRRSPHARRRGTTGPGGMETRATAETSSAMGAGARHGLARTNPPASIRLQENGSMPHLFSPFALGALPLANRIVIAPMCQYSAEDGKATDWHLIHLGHLALSGAGLMIIEATAVEPEGRISPADLGLWSDETEAALARVLGAVRRYSPMAIAIQLGHAGRKASSHVPWEGGQLIPPEAGGWRPVAPSALPHAADEPPPQALDREALDRVRQAFVDAARRAHRLGLDAIELHAAHGYLLHQFLSPLANARDDEYGGPLENRMRFPLEVFDAVRAAVPASLPVGVRLSATDWVEGGWDLEQSLVFGRALGERGCDFIHVSSGGVSPRQKIPIGPGYQVALAAAMRRDTGLPTIAVGLLTEAAQAEAIVAEGRADLVALARGMLYDPRWPWHAAAELGARVSAPPQYWRAQPQSLKGLFGDGRIGQR